MHTASYKFKDDGGQNPADVAAKIYKPLTEEKINRVLLMLEDRQLGKI